MNSSVTILASWTFQVGNRYGEALNSELTMEGYGDTNLLRNALIDRARDDADFEIIVAPALRFETAAVQRQYIDRTLRRRGPEKSLLLLNKADVG
jgi:hypothetical protein